MKKEQYIPSSEEIKKAEEIMTPMQRKATEFREKATKEDEKNQELIIEEKERALKLEVEEKDMEENKEKLREGIKNNVDVITEAMLKRELPPSFIFNLLCKVNLKNQIYITRESSNTFKFWGARPLKELESLDNRVPLGNKSGEDHNFVYHTDIGWGEKESYQSPKWGQKPMTNYIFKNLLATSDDSKHAERMWKEFQKIAKNNGYIVQEESTEVYTDVSDPEEREYIHVLKLVKEQSK